MTYGLFFMLVSVFLILWQIISKRLPQQQLNTLIFMLFEGLVDSQSNCSRASSVILNTLLKNRGAMLQDLVIIPAVIGRLCKNCMLQIAKIACLECFPSVGLLKVNSRLQCKYIFSSILYSVRAYMSGTRDVGDAACSAAGHL